MPARKAVSKKKKKKAATKKTAARTAAKKKSASKAQKKKSATRKKTPAKKKATSKKSTTKRTKSGASATARKKVAKKAAAKKASTAGKSASRKTVNTKTAAAKKPAAKKSAAKKTTSKKAPASKAATKKTAPASADTRRPAAAAARPAKPQPARRRSSIGTTELKAGTNLLNGPLRGFSPYQPKRGEEYMSESQLSHFREILLAWKRELMEEVDRTVLHMKDDAANFPDPNDRATQESEFGLELRTRDRERKLLRKIDAAITRIDDGSYGYCEETGDEIGLRRLEARPVATLCVEAQERRELAERQFRDREDYYR